jgi:hypothetical protein
MEGRRRTDNGSSATNGRLLVIKPGAMDRVAHFPMGVV